MSSADNIFYQSAKGGLAQRMANAEARASYKNAELTGDKAQELALQDAIDHSNEANDQAIFGVSLGASGAYKTAYGIGKSVGKKVMNTASSRLRRAITGFTQDAQNLQPTQPDPAQPDPQGADAYARNQPELDIDNINDRPALQDASTNLRMRVNNMDADTRQQVLDNFQNDPERIQNPADIEEYKNNVGVMEGHVKDAEADMNTRFTDPDLNNPNPVGGADAPAPPTLQDIRQFNPIQNNIDPRALGEDDENIMSLQQPRQLGQEAVNNLGNDIQSFTQRIRQGATQALQRGRQAVQDLGTRLRGGGEQLTQEAINQNRLQQIQQSDAILNDDHVAQLRRLGLNTGDLSTSEIDTGARYLLGDSAVEGISSLLGGVGSAVATALPVVGAIGDVASIYYGIKGLVDNAKAKQEEINDKANLEQSISNMNIPIQVEKAQDTPVLDSSQMRTGGFGNF